MRKQDGTEVPQHIRCVQEPEAEIHPPAQVSRKRRRRVGAGCLIPLGLLAFFRQPVQELEWGRFQQFLFSSAQPAESAFSTTRERGSALIYQAEFVWQGETLWEDDPEAEAQYCYEGYRLLAVGKNGHAVGRFPQTAAQASIFRARQSVQNERRSWVDGGSYFSQPDRSGIDGRLKQQGSVEFGIEVAYADGTRWGGAYHLYNTTLTTNADGTNGERQRVALEPSSHVSSAGLRAVWMLELRPARVANQRYPLCGRVIEVPLNR